MAHSIFKENKEKLQLKRQGHFLIDTIKWKGYSKGKVYYLLAQELGSMEDDVHFAKMNTLRELRAAVAALTILEKRLPKTAYASRGTKPRRKKSKPDLRENVIAVRDQPKPIAVVAPKKKPKPLSKLQRHNEVSTLPRQKVLEALEQMKRDRISRETQAVGLLATIRQWLRL